MVIFGKKFAFKIYLETEPTEEEFFMESVTSVLCREYAGFLKNMIMGEVLQYKGTKRDSFNLLHLLGHELLKNKVKNFFNIFYKIFNLGSFG